MTGWQVFLFVAGLAVAVIGAYEAADSRREQEQRNEDHKC